MNILIAPDKFKGSASALEVSISLQQGLTTNYPNADYIIHPMADGGDGSINILSNLYNDAEKIEIVCSNPLKKQIKATYLKQEQTAFIELASASGLALLNEKERNPMITTTLGTGELIKNALASGLNKIVLLIGGSATNDAGFGIAYALGFKFLDKRENEIFPTGGNLITINEIITPDNLPNFEINILCDVTNPFYGKKGAAYTYAFQKGANKNQIKLLDDGLRHISKLISSFTGVSIENMKGAGAAGGIAGGLCGLLNANLYNGFDYFSELTNLKKRIQEADIVITGEGKVDSQSIDGKVVGKIAEICSIYNKPLYIVAGSTEEPLETRKIKCNQLFTIVNHSSSTKDAIENAKNYLMKIGKMIRFS